VIAYWDEVERDRVDWPQATAWWTDLGRATGSAGVGLRLMDVDAGRLSVPVHIHSREEELVFVLAGADLASTGHPTRIGHSLRAGEEGLTYLAYGTREPNDICYYPRSNKIFLRGVGLIARLEPLDYKDGEPDD
jgi:uncharacterized cupin superfamily protein